MSSEQINREHLAAVVEARMVELDLNNDSIGDVGGPSTTTISKIRNGRLEAISPSTYRKLDAALRWHKGSARQVALGGDAVPMFAPLSVFTDRVAEIEGSNLSPDTKRWLIASLGRDALRPSSDASGTA